ncbi:MAG: hypothetical protein JWN31_1021 [Frankiales bacterium]|nr:hypothetical protein [Frankiales bacterium]
MTLVLPSPDLDDDVLAHAARDLAGAGSISFVVGEDAITYRVDQGQVLSEVGVKDGDTVVALDAAAWTNLVNQERSFINLFLTKELAFDRGGFEQLSDWYPALTYLHAGIPPYDPARADLQGRDPGRAMSLDDSDDELRAQLDTMGFMRVAAVFSAEEMATANAEIDRLADIAKPGDNESWWVTGEDGGDVLCRLVYATLRSPVLQALEQDPRVRRLGTLLDPEARVSADRMEGSAVLLKVPGKTKGLSNIPYHQDCGMGGHAILCPAVSIGIQLTGSNAETGNLTVVPGSHGQTMHYQWQQRLTDVPVVAVDTQPGDVTVHVQDVMHASPKPTGAGWRRTMYVTHYPPKLWDHVGPGQAYNDIVRNRTQEVSALA